MLRNIVLVLGGAMFASGSMALLSAHYTAAALLLVWGALIVFGIIYERYAYKTILDHLPAGKGWTRTTERFVDTKSGRIVTVYVKPITGERAYVAETLTSPATPVED
jgi:uncharacterized membrane protein HdeD (DUF308 family)